MNEAYTNSKYNGDEEWFLPLIVSDLLHYYNSKKVHLTTKMIPREILYNKKNKSTVGQAIVNTENSRLVFLQEIDFEVGNSVLLTLSIVKLSNKILRSIKRKSQSKVRNVWGNKLIAYKQK